MSFSKLNKVLVAAFVLQSANSIAYAQQVDQSKNVSILFEYAGLDAQNRWYTDVKIIDMNTGQSEKVNSFRAEMDPVFANQLETTRTTDSFVDQKTGKIYTPISIPSKLNDPSYGTDYWVFDTKNNSLERINIKHNESSTIHLNVPVGGIDSMIRYSADGALHIGENSLVTIEQDGVQKLYATDVNGDAIDIDISNGSDLLVNGVSVMGSINALEEKVNRINDRAATAAATAIAMSGLVFLPDMKFNLAANVGTYAGAHAVSVQVGYRASRNVAVTGGFAGGVNRGGKVGGRVGVVFGW